MSIQQLTKAVFACLVLAGFMPAFSQESVSLSSWQETIDKNIIATTQFPLYPVPDLGLIVCYDLRFDKELTLIDPFKQKIRRIGHKGPGPEEFGNYTVFTSKDGSLMGWDYFKSLIHVYDLSSGMVMKVVDLKPWVARFTDSLKVIGRTDGKWLARWPEHIKDAYANIDNYRKQQKLNTLVYGYIGRKEGEVHPKYKIQNPTGTLLQGISAIQQTLVHLGDRDILAIQNPVDFPEGKGMLIRLLSIPDWQESRVTFQIPDKFSRVGNDRFEDLKSQGMGIFYFSPDDHSPLPTRARVGLDNRIYYIFTADEKDGRVETMINILDPATLKTEQYVYEGTEIPYVFGPETVYCSDLAEDAIKVLPVSDVLNEKNRYHPE